MRDGVQAAIIPSKKACIVLIVDAPRLGAGSYVLCPAGCLVSPLHLTVISPTLVPGPPKKSVRFRSERAKPRERERSTEFIS